MLLLMRCGRLNKRDQNKFDDQYSDTRACRCWHRRNFRDGCYCQSKCPRSLNQDEFDSAILRATIGCVISSDEMRCPESASNQAI